MHQMYVFIRLQDQLTKTIWLLEVIRFILC